MGGTKVFVGQLPYSKTEADIFSIFQSVGRILEVVLLRSPDTNAKSGAAFVKYEHPQHALAAVQTLDGFLFPGSPRPISVSIANERADTRLQQPQQPLLPAPTQPLKRRPQVPMLTQTQTQMPRPVAQPTLPTMYTQYAQVPAAPLVTAKRQLDVDPMENSVKLFVGLLPFSKSEQDIEELFSTCGPVSEVHLLRDKTGQKTGAAFVRFPSAACLPRALKLSGYLFPGSTRAIVVSVAGEGKRQRIS